MEGAQAVGSVDHSSRMRGRTGQRSALSPTAEELPANLGPEHTWGDAHVGGEKTEVMLDFTADKNKSNSLQRNQPANSQYKEKLMMGCICVVFWFLLSKKCVC